MDKGVIFGPETARPHSQPINFVTGKEPPALLLHDDADTIVGPHNSADMAQRIRERGGTVRHLRYPDLGHREIVTNLAAVFRQGKPELPAIADFIREASTGTGSTTSPIQALRASE